MNSPQSATLPADERRGTGGVWRVKKMENGNGKNRPPCSLPALQLATDKSGHKERDCPFVLSDSRRQSELVVFEHHHHNASAQFIYLDIHADLCGREHAKESCVRHINKQLPCFRGRAAGD